MRSPRIRTAGTAIAGLAAAFTVAASAMPASAARLIHATYKVTGSTFLKAPNATLPLGPSKLAASLNAATGKRGNLAGTTDVIL